MANLAKISPIILALVLLVVTTVMVQTTKGQSPSECKKEKDDLVSACSGVVLLRLNPTPQCCERTRVSRIQCICPFVTPKVANLIDVSRLIHQIQGCGRTVPRNFKCGSITTPP